MDTVQGSEAWLAARKKFDVTGSELAAAVGIDPRKTANKLLQYKIYDTEQTKTIAMHYGNQFEETARDMFEAITGLKVINTGVCEIPEIAGVKLGSSPDGVAEDNSFTLEVKCKIGGNLPDSVETHHILQGLAHMEATSAPKCYFIYYTNFNEHERAHIFTMMRNTWLFRNAVKSWVKPFVDSVKYYNAPALWKGKPDHVPKSIWCKIPQLKTPAKAKAEIQTILRKRVQIFPGIV